MSERKSILLRLDPAVHDALARWAADELRSTNAQIEYLLRRALADSGQAAGPGGSDAQARPATAQRITRLATRRRHREGDRRRGHVLDQHLASSRRRSALPIRLRLGPCVYMEQ